MKTFSVHFKALLFLLVIVIFVSGCKKDEELTITVDFEGVVLPAEGFLGAANANGAHEINDVEFLAVYNSEYLISSGTIISSLIDTVTAGYTNSYSAWPGSGAGGSAKFGIINPPFGSTDPIITFATATGIKSVQVSNNTYAALSMRHGDAFAKAFTAADQDYFIVVFEGFNEQGSSTGTVKFYLADFRNGSNTGILNDWANVDLSALGTVKSIGVSFESSDVGTYGINTPLYVAIDNLMYEE